MSNPLISIAVATYNGEQYLKEQIDSLLAQTYTNIEIIICDDNSTDQTASVLQEYTNHPQIKVELNTQNLGYIKNFEKAISLCQGEYIALSDQDDIWMPNKLEVLLNNIGEDILIYSDALMVDSNLNSLNRWIIKPNNNFFSGSYPSMFVYGNFISGNTMMFRNSLLPYILPIPSDHKFHDWWIAFIASSVGTIGYVKDDLIYYRIHERQVTSDSKKSYKSLSDRIAQKSEQLQNRVIKKAKELHLFKEVEQLDSLTQKVIAKQLEHYQNYSKSFFNFSLFWLLYTHRNQIFHLLPQKKRRKRVIIESMGLKGHQWTLFTLGVETKY
jgi:glycosyltransferase involved in cell wall biosynthesis